MPETMESRVMGLEEFRTRYFPMGRRSAYEKAALGELPVPVIRIGRRLFISRDAVERLLTSDVLA